jgi:hypothetical protein
MPKLSLLERPAAERPLVVARRWDGLGGRLNALLNAWSVAAPLDADFRFCWRRNEDGSGGAEEIFSAAFLAAHLAEEDEFDEREPLPDPTELPLARARAASWQAEGDSFVDIAEYISILGFRDERHEAAGRRFRAAVAEIDWHPTLADVIRTVAAGFPMGAYSAIHVRAGDIVEGDWRQFLPAEKYTPRAFVEHAIRQALAEGHGGVLIVSDNRAYIEILKSRFDRIVTPADLLPGYARLTRQQQAFADIWLLSGAKRILGPTSSAFSRLAGNLSGSPVLGVHDMLAHEEARLVLRDGIAADGATAEASPTLRPMLVRDICWYLGVFGDWIPLGERAKLAARAARLEPDSCGALNNLALALAFRGRWVRSRAASRKAVTAAAAMHRHADPAVDSLATSISSDVIAFLLGPSGLARLFSQGVLGPKERAAFLHNLGESIERCAALVPYQIQHDDLLFNLRFQFAALHWLSALEGDEAEVMRDMLAVRDGGPLPGAGWRVPGLVDLEAPGGFPLTLRNAESVSIRLAEAIGCVVAKRQSGYTPPHFCYVDKIETSPSGLRWVRGWAYDAPAVPSGSGRYRSASALAISSGVPIRNRSRRRRRRPRGRSR